MMDGQSRSWDDMEDRWCVLRTSGPRTLPLWRSLVEAGFDAWTPVSVQQKRRGRARVRFDVDAPIMPTFVFARARHLAELQRAAASPINPHPAFSVFRHCGSTPLIADREISALRTEEGRARLARRRNERRAFKAGQSVQVSDGAWAGLSGVIEKDSAGRYAVVCFGSMEVKIAAFHLCEDGVEQNKSIEGADA